MSIKSKKRYIGITSNLIQRIAEHNRGATPSNKLNKPYKLVWYCAFRDKQKAHQFEKYLKSGSGHAFMNRHFA